VTLDYTGRLVSRVFMMRRATDGTVTQSDREMILETFFLMEEKRAMSTLFFQDLLCWQS
jgi:hypothetical protein